MSDRTDLQREEPQEERGAPGSRDKGGPPGAGQDRPAGHFGPEDVTGVDPKGPVDDESPYLPPGDQGG